MPELTPSSCRRGPLTATRDDIAVMLLARAEMPVEASARIAGRYSGRAPASTALAATSSTVNSHASCSNGRIRPTTSSGAWDVPESIAATRSSVGSTTGR